MKLISVFLVLLTTVATATDYQPWTKVDLQLYPRVDYIYQHYNKVKGSNGSLNRSGNDHILGFGMYACYSFYSLEFEGRLAHTRDLPCGLDHFKLTGKYQLWNDIVGDPLSVAVGGSVIAASRDAVEEYGLFHHAKLEGEVFVSLGRECSDLSNWLSRWWAMAGIGVGDRGSPWIFSQIAWEKKIFYEWQWRVFADLLFGLGNKAIDFSRQFQGYGLIRHRSVDLGAGIYCSSFCRGDFYLEFKQRVWAYNFPSYAQIFQVCYIYPFGL